MTSFEIALVAIAVPLWAIFIGTLISPSTWERFTSTPVGGLVEATWDAIEKMVAKALRIR